MLRRFLARLQRDTAANVLAIMGIGLIPLSMMVGGAVDLSRAYMTKTRMQSACDAASLAARRVMTNDTFSTEVDTTGKDFFAFNFEQGSYGTTTITPTVTRPRAGIVRVDASTSMPTVLMNMFGFGSIPLSVTCEASLNFVNTDIVLVLDVTGSMANSVGGTPKIQALQDAVMALYDELTPIQTQLKSQGLRLRYGVVPYSSTVNVGRLLYAQNASYLRSNVSVPSRVANFTTPVITSNAPTQSAAWQYYNGNWGSGSSSPTNNTLDSTDCRSWVESASVSGGGPAPSATTETRYRGSSSSSSFVQSQDWGWSGAPDTSGSGRSCRRWRVVETTTYNQDSQRFTNWTYRHETYNTSSFIQPSGSMQIAVDANGTVPNPGGSYNAQQLAAVATGVSTGTSTWNGCIEERETVSTISGGTSTTIPSGAHDLNIDLIPNSDATRWRPMMPDVTYTRNAGTTSVTSNAGPTNNTGWIKNYTYSQGYWACPTEARRLAEWNRADLLSYVNGLQTVGGTYHDIGMIWGARLISTAGVFGDGCDFYNNMPCNRHVIFMTDGDQTAYCNVLTAYGIEQNDLRVTGSGSCPSQLARHEQRFRMICNAAKAMNVSVWVIGFDTSLTANLQGCASNIGQASTVADRAALIARFREIGNQIGALRLTK